MKKLVLIVFLMLSTNVWASPPSRVSQYTTGTTILSSAVTANENAIFTYLQNGVDNFSDGSIVNADIAAGAGIAYSKLTLTGGILNSDINASAAIAYSKLSLTGMILNADLAGSIADSKLLQITTAGKVSGASLTSFSSIPSGAGVIPTANLGSGTANATTFLRGDQTYVTPFGHSAGDVLTARADTERTTTSGSYTKLKEISVPSSGTLRINWEMKTDSGSSAAYAKVYRNGSAVGVEQSTDQTTFQSKTDDVSGWSAGDLLQLYVHDTSSTAHVQNFRVTVATSYDFIVITD